MPITSNEIPEARSLTRTRAGDWRATRSWQVQGASNEDECYNATALDGRPVAREGDAHENPVLVCDSSTPSHPPDAGPFFWIVTAEYVIPSELTNGATELLSRKPRVLWRKQSYAVDAETDILKRPIINSAGDPVTGRTRPLRARFLRITRYEPYFDITKAAQFEDHVNSNTFQVGPIVILPGECLCDSIEPIEEYGIDAQVIQVAYDFEIRRGIRAVVNGSPQTVDPFQDLLVDKGRRGWYSDGGTPRIGEFCSENGTQLSDETLLDGTGKPINTTIKVLGGTLANPEVKTPIANPNLVTSLPSPDVTFSALSTDKVKVFEWPQRYSADFSQIGL